MILPPRLADLPRGTKLHAGLGYSTIIADWDVETYSEAGYEWMPDKFTIDERGRYKNLGGKWRKTVTDSKGRGGLFAVGAAVYTEDPTCDMLSMSYDLKDGLGTRRWRPGQPPPKDFCDYVAAGGLLEAHNAAFERWVSRNVLTPKYGFPLVQLHQQRCSMAKARAYALPGGLAPLGDVLKLNVQKSGEGKALLDLFSKPQNPTKKQPLRRVRPEDDPVKAERLYLYNDIDIETEAEASSKIPDLPDPELEYWFVDQTINDRGVHVDRESMLACIQIVEQAHARYNAELKSLTGVAKASKGAQILAWLADRGCHLDSLDEESVTGTLKMCDASLKKCDEFDAWERADALSDHAGPMPDPFWLGNLGRDGILLVRRVLEIRSLVASAAVKKVYAMRGQLTKAGRLHDLFSFHATRTGRPTGNGPQPTNFPNSGPDVWQCQCGRWAPTSIWNCRHCATMRTPAVKVHEWCVEAAEDALAAIRSCSLDVVESLWGDAMATVSACLRALFIAPEDKDLICSDYSAIEAVVNAELSGEQWRIDVFNGHGKIYEASAASMFGMSLDEMLEYKIRTGNHHPLRKKGKVAELALGYLGWIGALYDMGGYEGTEDEAKELCKAWRKANPNIVYLGGGQFTGWRESRRPFLHGLEGMAIAAIQSPNVSFPVMRKNGTHSGLTMLYAHDILHMFLPSGRSLKYHAPRLQPNTGQNAWRGLSISYEGWNTNPKNGPVGVWLRMGTYAGKLLENACQATANDILRFGQVNLEKVGYGLVLHVYDENVAEIAKSIGSVEHFEQVMNIMPPWATGWPIFARGGWRGKRYRK
jgi:DNA polymerase